MARSGDPRMGDILRQGVNGSIVFLGFPHDEGVRRNGGRVGARDGPAVVRRYLGRMGTVTNPEFGIEIGKWASLSDGGDVGIGLGLEAAHDALADTVEGILKLGGIPFVVGGGNDQSYPNARGLLRQCAGRSFGAVNIDAHLDVRPLNGDGQVHSGTPFRQLLCDPEFKRAHGTFAEFAAQGSQCSAEHATYVTDSGGSLHWLSALRKKESEGTPVAVQFRSLLNTLGDNVFVSFDLDAVRGADAPGVSCSSCVGLSAQEALDMCFAAGECPQVRLFDLSEFNPAIEDYRTGRLVVMMFYYFAMGVEARLRASAAATCT